MFLLDVLKQAVLITVFVLVMMLVIEYISVRTKGNRSKLFSKNPWLQILFSAILGIIPGCLGTFAVVSMYIHRTIGLAALVTALIATSGDEAFFMFSLIPGTALKIMILIFIISIITGVILQLILRNKQNIGRTLEHTFAHKDEPNCVCYDKKKLIPQLKRMIWERGLLLGLGFIFFILLIFGGSVHEHNFAIIENDNTEIENVIEHEHEHHHDHDHSDSDEGHSDWEWQRITYLVVTLIGFLIVISVPDHFLKKHLWGHVIKKHFLRLFLWTFGAFLALHFLNELIDVKKWIEGNIYLIILIAALIGLIPESGPHLIFIGLFMGNVVPFAVLLTNSIVQDGHGSIPLLAESGKSFIVAKLINFLVGLSIGYLFILFSS